MIIRNLILPIALISALALTAKNHSYELYVSISGNDANPGTMEQPLLTIARAWELARPIVGQKEVKIYCREGKHRISAPIVIDVSATADCPFTICPYPGENAVISSSVTVDSRWIRGDGGIWQTHIDQGDDMVFDVMFADGKRQTMARYPNENPDIAIFHGYAEDAISPERVGKWKKPVGGYVHAMHRSEWGGYQYIITGKDESGNLQLGAGFQNNRMNGMHPRYRMVENVFEELDTVGEWYCDRPKGVLYYYAAPGMDVNGMHVEFPQTESLFRVCGSAQSPVEYINIVGLDLTETTRTFLKTQEPLLRSDWKIYRGGAVLMENTRNCSVKDCHIHHIGGNAIFFSGYNRADSVTRNHIENIGASAVCFVGKPEAVRSPLFEYGESQPWDSIDKNAGPKTDDYPADCYVSDNLIHDIGEVEKQGAGIQLSMSMSIVVSHNSIYNLPRAGINVSEGTWGGHVIEWNDVFDTVKETGDHGSFNSWGRDRFWHPERGTMDALAAKYPGTHLLDAVKTTIIRNNRWRCDHGWDIDLDDGSSNYHIYNNLCLNGGLKLREGFDRTVENNIMVNNGFHPHVWFVNSNDIFRHNIVTKYYPIGINSWGKEIDYNFFVADVGLQAAVSAGTDVHSLSGDPLFVDADKGDYRVSLGSKVLDVGFKNFDMDKFGVMYKPLRDIASQPELPVFIRPEISGVEVDELFAWNGVVFKTVTTEGERSATGIDAVSGVYVIRNDNNSVDLRANDVLLEIEGCRITDIRALRELLGAAGKGTVLSGKKFRNQQESATRLIIE